MGNITSSDEMEQCLSYDNIQEERLHEIDPDPQIALMYTRRVISILEGHPEAQGQVSSDTVIMMARDLCYGVPEEEIEVSIVKAGSKMEVPKY